MINVIVTREYVNRQSDGTFEVDFVEENIRKKSIIRPLGCAGLSIYNATDTVVFVNNIPLNGLQTRVFRSIVPDCKLITEFRISDVITNNSIGIAIPLSPLTQHI